MLFDQDALSEELQLIEIEFEDYLKKIRTGRASKDVFDRIIVSAYGVGSPLNSVSNFVFDGPLSVMVKVWDKNLIPEVKKSLENAHLGASITDQGDYIRINFFPLTEEDRKERVKDLNKILEDYRVKVRLVRQDYMQKVKGLEGVSEDEQKVSEEKIQKMIDESIKNLEEIASKKEEEILSI